MIYTLNRRQTEYVTSNKQYMYYVFSYLDDESLIP